MRKKLFSFIRLVFIPVCGFVIACGGAAGKAGTKSGDKTETSASGERIHSEQTKADFAKAVEKYKAAKQAGWNKDSCSSAASKFEKVADDHSNMSEALYNAGAVYRDCGMKAEAKAAFNKTLKLYPKHQYALTDLAIMALEKGDENQAQDYLRKAVEAGPAKLEAVPAYVVAATILRKQAAQTGDDDKFAKAQLNLRRALAIDSKYMPALYQLAVLYVNTAIVKNKASFLTLAQLVCTQAANLNPEYGPIYHVMGQINLQKNQLVDALQSFQKAFTKDPTLFASFMNYAAINLGFRGYDEAKMAFEKAIGLNPKSYDAHIGLGVALRGLGDFQGAKAEYKKASEIDKNRIDYVFNTGVLEMDYVNDGTPQGFDKAKAIFQKYIDNASQRDKVDPDGKGPMLSWHDKAKNRIALCEDNKKKVIEAEKEMAEMEKLQKEQAAREEEMKRQMEKAKELEKKEAQGAVAPGAAEGAETGAAGAVEGAATTTTETNKEAAAPDTGKAGKTETDKGAAAPDTGKEAGKTETDKEKDKKKK